MTSLTIIPNAVSLPGVTSINGSGLTLRTGLSCEAYAQTGQFLKEAAQAAQLWLADWRAQGVRLLGKDVADEIAEQLTLEIQVPQWMPPPETRTHANLTPEHYFVAGKEAASDADAATWLDAADKAKLTPSQLRESIRAGEIRACRTPTAGTRIGIPTIHRVAMEFGLFAKSVEVADYTADDCRQALEILKPLLAWVTKVVRHLDELEEKEGGK